MSKRAFITGMDGQDGRILSKFLLGQGYEVYGLARKHTQQEERPQDESVPRAVRIYGDLMDFPSVFDCIRSIEPDEVYNLAGQSDIPTSWRQPVLTVETNAIGTMRLLESILHLKPQARFFQASTSEIFGANSPDLLDESSPFAPRNPYGSAKLFAHTACVNYRESYDMYACGGILFNHESPKRSLNFVTRKITHAVARISMGKQKCLEVGNLDAVRDWGHAEDYVRAMWLMLQQEQPQDYIIATGEGHTVREFITAAFTVVGITLIWQGADLDEIAIDSTTGKTVVAVNPAFYRFPKEDSIIGNPLKINMQLGFTRKYQFEAIVAEMVEYDLALLRKWGDA